MYKFISFHGSIPTANCLSLFEVERRWFWWTFHGISNRLYLVPISNNCIPFHIAPDGNVGPENNWKI